MGLQNNFLAGPNLVNGFTVGFHVNRTVSKFEKYNCCTQAEKKQCAELLTILQCSFIMYAYVCMHLNRQTRHLYLKFYFTFSQRFLMMPTIHYKNKESQQKIKVICVISSCNNHVFDYSSEEREKPVSPHSIKAVQRDQTTKKKI